ncbi:hydroxysqualene dehydroxylase [Magnetospirillum molischianum]|uniref:Amine oxidase domain-containing protein n=1 Tax=Magnetospirillum molischianum DSM 120 TaxID=1150626 RepID=H8FVQ0_MAGML|nr:FAD-dependent oxidoreductase [Magnetospirillum molischianum]CCG42438.1 conserved exported hypothetical protein [Magnetospirillum molischianum DSM 120]
MSNPKTLHVVGAGLAGLAAATAAARAGTRVCLYESASHAGGRCRSFFDDKLNRLIDNGSHLLLGANRIALSYARATGGIEAMVPAPPRFDFFDLADKSRWTVSPTSLPAGLGEILLALGLPWTGAETSVSDKLGQTRSFSRLWKPLCEAILNTTPEESSARMFSWTMRRALLGGAPALSPWTFPLGLSAALVAPALATLSTFGAEIHFRHRLIGVAPDRLNFDNRSVKLGPNDRVILALPPWAAAAVLPSWIPPLPTRTIVNAHFRLDHAVTLPQGVPFMGLVNGYAHWLFPRGDVLSVTVSAAEGLVDRSGEEIADILWNEATLAIGMPARPVPPARVIKERRATLAHDPATIVSRPGHETPIPGLFLAGDWLRSPWPCTIEAAVSSGLYAAQRALEQKTLSFGL